MLTLLLRPPVPAPVPELLLADDLWLLLDFAVKRPKNRIQLAILLVMRVQRKIVVLTFGGLVGAAGYLRWGEQRGGVRWKKPVSTRGKAGETLGGALKPGKVLLRGYVRGCHGVPGWIDA